MDRDPSANPSPHADSQAEAGVFQRLLERSPHGLAVLRGDPARTVFANAPLASILGLKVDELRDLAPGGLAKRFHADDRALFTRRYYEVLEGKTEPSRFGLRVVRPGGEVRLVDIYAEGISYEGYSAVHVGVVDVTSRREAEERLLRLSGAVDASIDSVVISDLSTRIVDVNEASLTMYGTEHREDLVGKRAFELIVPEEHEAVREGMEEVLDKGFVKAREYTIITRSGARIPVEMSTALLKDRDGNPAGFIAVSRDISERKLAELELRASEERYRRVLEHSLDGIAILDASGLLVEMNPAAALILGGREPGDLHGKTFFEVLSGDSADRLGGIFARLVRDGHLAGEFELVLRDGKELVVDVEASLLDEGLYLVRARDVTRERQLADQDKEAELRLIQADRLSALGTMAAGLAHEMNQPLNTIQVVASGMQLGMERSWDLSDEQLNENLQMIQRQVRRMAEIIRNVRRFARRDRTRKLEKIDLNDVVRETLKILTAQLRFHSIELRLSLADDLPRIMASFNPLEQVVINLVSNAQDAMDDTPQGLPRVLTVTTRAKEREVVLEVSDTGPGFSDPVIKNLFIPFFTTKEPGRGTGLGLPISQAIAGDYGGTLEANNHEAGGATFTLRLPALPGENP